MVISSTAFTKLKANTKKKNKNKKRRTKQSGEKREKYKRLYQINDNDSKWKYGNSGAVLIFINIFTYDPNYI